uniref:Family with sequence similarity 204 member A n=1 Tax=Bubo bubo TaxID=30461 RepID=A0A8C0FHC7_BUBBB
MWSGLLPPGLNESDVDLSSDDGDESHGSFSKEDAKEDTGRVQLSEFQENGPESNVSSEPIVVPVTDGENGSQTCPSGISLTMWNKFVELQKKNREMKTQAHQESKSRKRKRHRKGVLYNLLSQNRKKWKELTQYFGINDRFESPVDSKAPQKVTVDAKNSALTEIGIKLRLFETAACRNFVKAKQEAEAAQEARKKKKLAWGFEAKKRWETKSNMGYM